jgi:bacterioferritin (cytochrome b1)
MNTPLVIETLNKAVALEHAACIQYKQHALLVRGLWRKVFADFLYEESRSAQEHAYKFGQKIVALGGIPTIDVGAPVRQSLDLVEMLQQDLEMERQAKEAYEEALVLCQDDTALRVMLEDQIKSEQDDIEELEMYLEMVQTQAVEPSLELQVV